MNPKDNPSKNNKSSFVKYMGMPFQLLALMGLAAYIGHLLDKQIGNGNQYCMILFALIALIAFLYKIVKTESL